MSKNIKLSYYFTFLTISCAIISGTSLFLSGLTSLTNERIILNTSPILNNLTYSFVIYFDDCKYIEQNNWSNYTEMNNYINNNYVIGQSYYTNKFGVKNNYYCLIVNKDKQIESIFVILIGILVIFMGFSFLVLTFYKAINTTRILP